MLENNGLVDRRFALRRGGACLPQFLTVKFLREVPILLPPAANGAHVVRGRGDDAQIRRAGRAGKFAVHFLGHALDFEAQQAQLLHQVRHAGWHEPEVFAADEHVGDALQRRKFLQRLLHPEIILPAEEVIHIKLLEPRLGFWVKVFEGQCVFHRKTEMEFAA